VRCFEPSRRTIATSQKNTRKRLDEKDEERAFITWFLWWQQ
jgi:hypothetical protein